MEKWAAPAHVPPPLWLPPWATAAGAEVEQARHCMVHATAWCARTRGCTALSAVHQARRPHAHSPQPPRRSGAAHWHAPLTHTHPCLQTRVTLPPNPHSLCRLTLDKEDILAWGSYSKDEVLLYSCLSAKWENNDAIDKAVTGSLGDKKVRVGAGGCVRM